jgi:hypothetical protein
MQLRCRLFVMYMYILRAMLRDRYCHLFGAKNALSAHREIVDTPHHIATHFHSHTHTHTHSLSLCSYFTQLYDLAPLHTFFTVTMHPNNESSQASSLIVIELFEWMLRGNIFC